jgi:hypothetical protein
MIDTLLSIFLNSLIIIGIFYSFGEEQVFGKVGAQLQLVLGEFWSKPALACPVCMSSVWGTLFFLLKTVPFNPFDYIIHILALAGLIVIYVHTGIVKIWMVER